MTSTTGGVGTTTTMPALPANPATPTLADGRPATFIAVTDDFRAVEVDTATGEIIYVFGQTGTPAGVDAAEEMPPNVLVGAWRVRGGEVIGLSDCCEPAAGRLFFVGAGETLGEDPYSSSGQWNAGWTLSPSPTDNTFASIGYSLGLYDPTDLSTSGTGAWIDDESLGFPSGVAAWTRDGSQLYWTTQIEQVTGLASLDVADGEPSHVTVLPWVGVHQYLDGIGTQPNGNLVGFLHTSNDDFETVESQGVVFSESGELLANFPVETGSLWGGYDQSGRFLIYVDGEGNVRWQGLGESGLLADGYIFASW
ncbi:MAG: hypothetical protein U9N84_10065 [Actinomycetota bacterium]|nr:hypothetical protein [Actinomycetota bacterium]